MRILKKLLKYALVVALVLTGLALLVGTIAYFRARGQVYAEYSGDPPSVLAYLDEAPPPAQEAAPGPEAVDTLFEPALFQDPDPAFGPWTRWWWPGNDVEPDELRREIQMFGELGFGGVEIQPFTGGLDPEAPVERQAGVYSYDTEGYFENLRVVMRAAREAGLGVDISAGGGWPSGGPHIAPEDNFRTLAYTETTVKGGGDVTVTLEKPSAPFVYWLMGPGMGLVLPGLGGNMLYFYRDEAELVEVVAAPVLEDGRSRLPWKLNDQVVLDREGVQLLLDRVDDEGRLRWSAPPGEWQVVGIWSMPDGEPPILVPTRDPGLVVDHLDRQRVVAHYNYLFGERAGLTEFHGHPFRAVFNDSYEFKVDRHFTRDFLDEFERRRGYDLRPWLPAMLLPTHNNVFATFLIPGEKRPAFRLSDDDDRVSYDYDLTVSELFVERFLDTTSEWMAARGLQNRTQAYGLIFDVIRGMGHAHIPETEQLAGDGSEMFLRMASSGAELYNRPVVTAESLVWMGRDHMTTPQKTKIAVDKLLTSGVNQVIYHGTPYRYADAYYGELGWHPFSSPAMGMISFSSNVAESSPYWKYQRDVNRYIARGQYLMRLGRPATDVLVYYPFLGNTFQGQEGELLTRGVLEGPEPPLAAGLSIEPPTGQQTRWERQAWDTIRELDRLGISWAWVNDDSLQEATLEKGAIHIRGNEYGAVVLAEVPWLQPDTAGRLAELAERGAAVVVIGAAPDRQPGYRDLEENDALVEACSRRILTSKGGLNLKDPAELSALTDILTRPVAFADPYPFLKHRGRALADGSRIVYFWNTSADDVRFTLVLDEGLGEAWWLDPVDGGLHPAERDASGGVSGTLGPYGSVALFATRDGEIPEDVLSPPGERTRQDRMRPVQHLDRWDLQAGGVHRPDTLLFDWRDDLDLRHSSEPAIYTAVFTLEEKNPEERYLVDLGSVYFTADVEVNQQAAGSVLFAPYRLDITDHVIVGENEIEVIVTPAARNGLIGRALAGDEAYARLEGQEDRLMSAGLVGPVRLLVLDVDG